MLPNNPIIITYKLALPFIIVIIYVGFSTSNFNYFTVICLCNISKQGIQKLTAVTTHQDFYFLVRFVVVPSLFPPMQCTQCLGSALMSCVAKFIFPTKHHFVSNHTF